MRRPIRKKVQSLVLAVSIAALIITSTVGLISMFLIRGNSESALIHQMEQNLYNITTNKAELADSELGKFTNYIENFAGYIHEIYKNPSGYVSREVFPPTKENAGVLVLQKGYRDETVNKDAVKDESSLLGNVEQVWAPVMQSNKGVITTIYFGTESGFMIAYDDQSEISDNGGNDVYYDYSKSEWYKLAKETGKTYFTDIYNDAYNRGLMITCLAPFYDANNKFAGAVGMDILISDLHKAVVNIDLGEEAFAFLVDEAGKIINPSGQELNESDVLRPSVAGEILSGKTGISLADNMTYYAYTPIKSTGWKFCITIPRDVILSPVNRVNRNIIITIILFLVVFLMIIMIVAFVSRTFSTRLTNPIIELGHDVEKISGGNLDYRAEIRSDDEIGDLAQNFNNMAASLKEYVKNLAAVTAEKERIGAELNVATQIQADMLPRIFPPFPDRKEFDIYATMTPAKEVGGDFYDFFMIDDDHLALVMADVSGKGVPAALFMVIAKTLIKTRSQIGGSPSEILHDVNNQLCEGNEADLFVTVWLGILEISTGKVTASNAGHEYPAIRHVGGNYELIKSKPSPAVATMEGLKFRQNEFTLNPGDNLYLYTDGVAEATNSNEELYGTDRMLKALDDTKNFSAEEILSSMKQDVDAFTGDAPQFDDITMLCLRYFGGKNFMKELTIEADVNNLEKVISFVDEQLEAHDCSPKIQMQIDVAVEELFVNIAHYAYNPETGPATVRVELQEEPLAVLITFIDNGVPYDPLAKEDPDITLPAEERQIGGLGIYMVKKSMDDIVYEYKDGKNILTIKKEL
ncbi:MAG: SpoIIE family protein phosphatase [Synergistaceae bacterium]|nr:SpoIIE family protein phosphatase [Synergistaceae bacterium]